MRVTKERVKSRPEANGLESVELSSDKSGVETELAAVNEYRSSQLRVELHKETKSNVLFFASRGGCAWILQSRMSNSNSQ